MKYYNQYDFKNTPYPSNQLPNASVASGGCGVCCGSMIVEALTDKAFSPDKMAQYAINAYARVDGGTDMHILGRAIAKDFGVRFSTTSDMDELIQHLDKNLAIINVSGDRSGYTGVFSSGGHFIVGIGISDDKIIIWDPGYYWGKFDKAGRAGKVEVDYPNLYVSPEIIDLDCETRYPKYYLFSKAENGEDENMALVKELMSRTGKSEEEVVQALSVLIQFANVKEDEYEKEGVQKLKDMGLINSDHDGRELIGFGTLGIMLGRLNNRRY